MANPKFTACKLYAKGQKNQNNSNNNFYQIPQPLADIIFNELGNKSAQLRLMLVLIGTKQNGDKPFEIHQNWLMDRTGLSAKSISEARKALEARGWITFKEYQYLTINYDVIYGKVSTLKSTQFSS